MEKSKVISVRVPSEVLEKLEKTAKGSFYHTKSDFINAGIKLALAAVEKGELQKIMRFLPEFGDVVDEFVFKYHREVKR